MAMAGTETTTSFTRTYPFECELCHTQIESEDDQMWWHGYGNCVEIPDGTVKMYNSDDELVQECRL